MEGRNRTIFVVLIAIVIVAAVFSSFGLNLFSNQTPEIKLPVMTEPGEETDHGPGQNTGTDRFVRVQVTADTVQDVIATLKRPESYYREVTIETLRGENEYGSAMTRVWVDAGWTQSQTRLVNGQTRYSLVGDGTVYRWYDSNWAYESWPADGASADVDAQRIPTYEDVLAAEKANITATNYEEKGGLSCIFVEVAEETLGYLERYWISVEQGLLVAAETVKKDELIYRMSAYSIELPVRADTVFALPDGTVLHEIDA